MKSLQRENEKSGPDFALGKPTNVFVASATGGHGEAKQHERKFQVLTLFHFSSVYILVVFESDFLYPKTLSTLQACLALLLFSETPIFDTYISQSRSDYLQLIQIF